MIIFSSHLFHPTGAAPLRHFYTITHTPHIRRRFLECAVVKYLLMQVVGLE